MRKIYLASEIGMGGGGDILEMMRFIRSSKNSGIHLISVLSVNSHAGYAVTFPGI